jgi:hypothetical protein
MAIFSLNKISLLASKTQDRIGSLSNKQMAKELDVHLSDGQQMTTQLREGIVKKSPL